MKAYLEQIQKQWLDDFVYLAVEPLKELGIEIIPFDGTDLKKFAHFSFEENDIVIGSVEATEIFFKNQGKTIKALGYPLEFEDWYERDIRKTIYSKVDSHFSYPFFIKPATDVKLFTGSVCESKKQLDLIPFLTPEVKWDTEVYISEVVEFLSEYRCFVHKGKLVGIKHYKGDFTLFPDVEDINFLIEKYTSAPISYTLDIGLRYWNDPLGYHNEILSTLVVEVNDFWAIGGYGLDGKTYVRMLIDRFQEIKNS